MPREETAVVPPLGARDLWLAGAWALAAGLLYLATLQVRLYGDGPGLVDFTWFGTGRSYHHVLYLPLTRLLAGLVGRGSLLLPLELASLLPAALGVGGVYLLLRELGCRALGAAFGTALYALSPPIWFFATNVEVHALHGGVAPFAYLAVLRAPWRSRLAGYGVCVLALAALYGTHQFGTLLGLGIVLLAGLAARRAGRPFTPAGLLLGLGPALLLALVLILGAATLWRFGSFDPRLEFSAAADLAGKAAGGVQLGPLERLVQAAWSLGLLVPAALLGALLGGPSGFGSRSARWLVILALVLLPFLVVVFWGVLERGGYFLPGLPLLAWPAARLAEGRSAWVAFLVLLPQGALSLTRIHSWDRGFVPADRTQLLIEAAGGEPTGNLITLAGLAPSAKLLAPGIQEHSLGESLALAGIEGARPEDAAGAALGLGVLLGAGPLFVDATLTKHPDQFGHSPLAPYQQAFFDSVEQHFEIEAFDRGSWRIWRVLGQRETPAGG